MDGGLSLLLVGKGQRKFEPVWPDESGIAINCASYGAASADFDGDGDIDIAVGANNNRLRLLQNCSEADTGTGIRLIGDHGNPHAVGARILLVGDGFERAYELTSGGSYLSHTYSRQLIVPKVFAARTDSIEVFWPDGTTSKHDFDSANDGVVTIEKISQ